MSFACFQKTIHLPSHPRGCHLITDTLLQHLHADLSKVRMGTCNLFLQHTSASLTLNENCDPDVRVDMEMMLNKLVPENAAYTHTDEGSDDMPGHVKCSLFGASITVPVSDGRLALGTWQGVWLCEHRNRASMFPEGCGVCVKVA